MYPGVSQPSPGQNCRDSGYAQYRGGYSEFRIYRVYVSGEIADSLGANVGTGDAPV